MNRHDLHKSSPQLSDKVNLSSDTEQSTATADTTSDPSTGTSTPLTTDTDGETSVSTPLHDAVTGEFPVVLAAAVPMVDLSPSSSVSSSTGLLRSEMKDDAQHQKTDAQRAAKRSRIEATRKRVDKLTEKARESVQLILERGDKIEDLNERAHNLLTESYQFKKTTKTLKTKLWRKNMKMMIGVGVALVVLIVVLLIAFLPQSRVAINSLKRQTIQYPNHLFIT
ncbi:hypothetical protein BV898_17389 [Hypsibius exemplaris]|uniref:V-SNARE coiled-coil homology domain-containing protein n=1 Tax=Hypsibius exemplaris TaxID=2072580 RepID=A0A9X6NEZ2_HYPEX|nr:hypothetical protein BV898_17389 [Hypsibius exemplaris]